MVYVAPIHNRYHLNTRYTYSKYIERYTIFRGMPRFLGFYIHNFSTYCIIVINATLCVEDSHKTQIKYIIVWGYESTLIHDMLAPVKHYVYRLMNPPLCSVSYRWKKEHNDFSSCLRVEGNAAQMDFRDVSPQKLLVQTGGREQHCSG